MKMKRKQEKFEGLSIILKRRKLYVTAPEEDDDYFVFGYYDKMKIEYIEKWGEWLPTKTEKLSLDDSFIDKYTMKAYFPKQKCQKTLQKELGLDYDIWKKDDEFAFVVAIVANVSKSFILHYKELNLKKDILSFFSQTMSQFIQKTKYKDNWKMFHCAVFQTIGFSDLVILLKSNNLKGMLGVCEYIQQFHDENQNPCISNAYTLVAFRERELEKVKEEETEDIKLSIRVGLRKGATARAFCDYFEEEAGKEIGEAIKNQKYRISGDADCLVVSEMDLKSFLPLYFRKNNAPRLLHPGHELFNRYINNIRSEIRMLAKEEMAPILQDNTSNKNKIAQYKKKFKNELEEVKNCITDNNVPNRVVVGLEIVMKRFLELIQVEHCFDIECLINEVFDRLFQCIRLNLTLIKEVKEAEGDIYGEIQLMNIALNEFRERVGTYLSDMLRSDSLFLEGRSLTHTSVGSATKLLFFYNGYINRVKEMLCEKSGEKAKYGFLVTSGGTDKTEAIDLFGHLDPTVTEAASLIILTIPESSLYDVAGSLFKLLHEILHFCGNRMRRERANHVINCISKYLAQDLAWMFEKHQKDFYEENIFQILEKVYGKEKLDKVRKSFKDVLDKKTTNLKVDLCEYLANKIKSEWNSGGVEESVYYGQKFYGTFQVFMKEKVFYYKKVNPLVDILYEKFMIFRRDIAKSTGKILCTNAILYSNVDFVLVTLESKIEKYEFEKYESEKRAGKYEIEWNDKDICYICKIILQYFNMDFSELGLCEKFERYNSKKQIMDLDTLLSVLADLFKECYADCMAAKILDLSMKEFVLAFLAEEWNEKNAFQDTDFGRLRMIIDFQWLYQIKDGLSKNQKREIQEALDRKKKWGFEHIKEEEEGSLSEWLNRILSRSDMNEGLAGIVANVCDYIEKCYENWKDEKIFSDIKVKTHFSKQMIGADASGTFAFLNKITKYWIDFAKEQK